MNDEFEQLITQHSSFIIRRRRFSGELRLSACDAQAGIEDAEKMVGK